MGYYIDLKTIDIDRYKEMLRSADLIPSWMVLKDNIDENLDAVKNAGIRNLNDLKEALKDKKRVQEFSNRSGLPEQYLAVLGRVIRGYHPKPNRIQDFPGIAEDVVAALAGAGLKNTLQLYDRILTAETRAELSDKIGVDEREIMRLARLTDLSRVRWVNHTFASVLMEAGYDSAESVARADYRKMYAVIKQLNAEKALYKGNIGEHDMKLCVEAAQGLDFEIAY